MLSLLTTLHSAVIRETTYDPGVATVCSVTEIRPHQPRSQRKQLQIHYTKSKIFVKESLSGSQRKVTGTMMRALHIVVSTTWRARKWEHANQTPSRAAGSMTCTPTSGHH